MKKPTQKQTKEYLKNIFNHFSALIDTIIWYDEHDMDDWGYEIIDHIEKLPLNELVLYLFNDLSHRKEEDFSNLLYQGMWYAMFNVDQEKAQTHQKIVSLLKNHSNKEIALAYLSQQLDEGGDSHDEQNIRLILKEFNRE